MRCAPTTHLEYAEYCASRPLAAIVLRGPAIELHESIQNSSPTRSCFATIGTLAGATANLAVRSTRGPRVAASGMQSISSFDVTTWTPIESFSGVTF